MSPEEFAGLAEGDLVRSRFSGEAYIVSTAFDGLRVVATRVVTMHNPGEWELVPAADEDEG